MSLTIRRYRAEDREAIAAFNERFAAAGIDHQLYPESDVELQGDPGAPRFTRLLVAADEAGVHGGVWLTTQAIRVAGQDDRAGWIRYPLSESLADPAYTGVPAAMVFGMMREEPVLMSLGLGGHHTPFAKLLTGLKWVGTTVPFYFRFVRAGAVLRNLGKARSSRARRLVADLLATTGLGALGLRLINLWRGGAASQACKDLEVTIVDRFDAWADDVWLAARDHYRLVSAKDATTLNDLYPADFPGLTRMRVRRDGKDIGWVCTTIMDLRDGPPHHHFGNMVVGGIADGLGAPEDATDLVAAATDYLIDTGTDLLVSNQSHPAWGDALRSQLFFEGPSNFAFYRPAPFEQRLEEDQVERAIHLTRGDGDGPKWA